MSAGLAVDAARLLPAEVPWTDAMYETLGGALYGSALAPLGSLSAHELEVVLDALTSNLRGRHRAATG